MSEPGKVEYYLAQVAYILAASAAKDPRSVKFDTYLLKFKRQRKSGPVLMGDQIAQSKQAWIAATGAKPNPVKTD